MAHQHRVTTENLARRSRQPNDAASYLLEPQNIEQGMSNEEGHELTDQIATKNAKIQEVYETANSRNRNQPNQTSRVFLRLFVAISSFFLRHSLFDIHLFVFGWSLNSCQKNKLSRICSTEDAQPLIMRRSPVSSSTTPRTAPTTTKATCSRQILNRPAQAAHPGQAE